MHGHYQLLPAEVVANVLIVREQTVLFRCQVLLHVHRHVMSRRNESKYAVILWLFRSFATVITVENEFLDHRFILVAFLIQASAHRDLIAN